MGHDWILDVLTDLETFARSNGLPTLAAQLDEVHLIAQAEMASRGEGTKIGVRGQHAAVGCSDRAIGMRGVS